MRMLEWQTESSLFTIRVRGRQWYWVYKIELKELMKATTANKNIGHDYWELFSSPHNNSYFINELAIRFHNREYLGIYKRQVKSLQKTIGKSNSGTGFLFENKKKKSLYKSTAFFNDFTDYDLCSSSAMNFHKKSYKSIYDSFKKELVDIHNLKNLIKLGQFMNCEGKLKTFFLQQDATDPNKRMLRASNYSIPKHLSVDNQFNTNWYDSTSRIITKSPSENLYFVTKQKRFVPQTRKIIDVDPEIISSHFILKNFNTLVIKKETQCLRKWYAKRLKYKSPKLSLVYNKRMLRTRRVLVLPTLINLTLITNSFDVVHSWYIPGLGIKMDCIPGRSTHHTIFIDHAGFYYGQCAEICGRQHHHMPIRLCALPFEHFLVWWYHYGLPYFNASTEEPADRKLSVSGGLKQYSF